MHITATTDVSVIPATSHDEVSLLLSLQAPAAAADEEQAVRGPVSLVVVLDRSGSMGGGRLANARRSLLALVERLAPTDTFGLVTFDDEIDVVVPTAPLTNKEAVKRRIAGVQARGMTNLSGGFLRGLEEARRAPDGAPRTVLLLSDGKANVGVTDPTTLATLAEGGRAEGITTSTLGIGLGYDETLLEALARGGTGNHYFAETEDAAAEAFASEIGGLLDAVALGTSVLIRPGDIVTEMSLLNHLPCTRLEEGLRVEVGDLYAEEQRRLVVVARVAPSANLGRTRLAEIVTSWFDVSRGAAPTCATTVVSLDVVDAEHAAQRAVDDEIRAERSLLEAQRHRRDAAEALARGAFDEADRLFGEAMTAVESAPESLPDALAAELREDRLVNQAFRGRMVQESSRVAKLARSSAYAASAKRGRRPRPHPSREPGTTGEPGPSGEPGQTGKSDQTR